MPDIDLTRTGICCAIAFAAGLIDAMAGGGGILTIPTIEMAFRPTIPQVLGTNKFVGTSGSSTATVSFLLKGKMDRFAATLGGLCAGVGAVGGAVVVASLGKLDDRITRPIFGALLIAMAIYMFFKPKFGGENAWQGPTPRNVAILVGSGLLIGFYDGFFGPGTGSFLVFVMVRFLKFDFVIGTGNAKAMNFASNITSLATFIWKGLVIWPIAIPMGVANALGSYVGSSIAISQGARFVRWVFLVAAVAIAARMAAGLLIGR